MVVGVDGGDDLGVVGGFHGKRGAAMESFLRHQDAGAARVERGEFQGVLVGLGSAVHQKQLVIVVAAYLTQTGGQLPL